MFVSIFISVFGASHVTKINWCESHLLGNIFFRPLSLSKWSAFHVTTERLASEPQFSQRHDPWLRRTKPSMSAQSTKCCELYLTCWFLSLNQSYKKMKWQTAEKYWHVVHCMYRHDAYLLLAPKFRFSNISFCSIYWLISNSLHCFAEPKDSSVRRSHQVSPSCLLSQLKLQLYRYSGTSLNTVTHWNGKSGLIERWQYYITGGYRPILSTGIQFGTEQGWP